MATTYTPNLQLPMQAGTDPASIALINNAMQLIDTAVMTSKKGKAAANELDNANLADPVNQRALTTYNGSGYCIDRWRTNFSGDRVQISTGGVTNTVDSTTNGWHMHQVVVNAKRFAGKTMTAAFRVTAMQGSGIRGVISYRNSADEEISNSSVVLKNGVCVVSKAAPAETELIRVGLYAYSGTAAGDYVRLQWAALYEGGYTEEALPDFVPRNKAVEEAICKRYYRRIKANSSTPSNAILNGFISSESKRLYLPVPEFAGMRSAPAVEISGSVVVRKAEGGYLTDASYSAPYSGAVVTAVQADGGQSVGIIVGKSDDSAWAGATNNSMCSMILYSDGLIEASAEPNP